VINQLEQLVTRNELEDRIRRSDLPRLTTNILHIFLDGDRLI
jgi:hypothetical protein